MKRIAISLVALLMSVFTLTTAANAALINTPVDPSEYITLGSEEWAWTSPCAPVGGCVPFDLSLQGTLGWAVATTSQIDAVIALAGGLTQFVNLFAVTDVCAAAYFNSVFANCQFADGYAGNIFNYSATSNPGNQGLETLAVRVSAVPVPAGVLLMLGGLGLLGALKRRKV
jgi:hypothetical protein